MNEDPSLRQSWVSEGSMDKLLDTFAEFPSWLTSIFKSDISSRLVTIDILTVHVDTPRTLACGNYVTW